MHDAASIGSTTSRAAWRWPQADPRVKTACAVAIVACALFARTSLYGQVLLLAFTGALLAQCDGGWRALAANLRRIAPFAVVVIALNGIIVRGDAVLTLGTTTVLSRQGLEAGAYFAVRLAVMVLALVALLAATSPEEFARVVFTTLHPFSPAMARRVALHTFLSMSFLPMFRGEFHRISVAQSFRSGGGGNEPIRRLAGMRSILVPLLLSAIHRSGQLAMVVELRGLKDRMGEGLLLYGVGWRDAALLGVTASVCVFAGVV